MNALDDKVHKNEEVVCTPYNMATLFNNHPYYISSTTATYVGINRRKSLYTACF